MYLKGKGEVTCIECHPSYILIPSFEIKSSITKSGKSLHRTLK